MLFLTAVSRMMRVSSKGYPMLTVAMVILGLVTFAAMLAFVKLCDHV